MSKSTSAPSSREPQEGIVHSATPATSVHVPKQDRGDKRKTFKQGSYRDKASQAIEKGLPIPVQTPTQEFQTLWPGAYEQPVPLVPPFAWQSLYPSGLYGMQTYPRGYDPSARYMSADLAAAYVAGYAASNGTGAFVQPSGQHVPPGPHGAFPVSAYPPYGHVPWPLYPPQLSGVYLPHGESAPSARVATDPSASPPPAQSSLSEHQTHGLGDSHTDARSTSGPLDDESDLPSAFVPIPHERKEVGSTPDDTDTDKDAGVATASSADTAPDNPSWSFASIVKSATKGKTAAESISHAPAGANKGKPDKAPVRGSILCTEDKSVTCVSCVGVPAGSVCVHVFRVDARDEQARCRVPRVWDFMETSGFDAKFVTGPYGAQLIMHWPRGMERLAVSSLPKESGRYIMPCGSAIPPEYRETIYSQAYYCNACRDDFAKTGQASPDPTTVSHMQIVPASSKSDEAPVSLYRFVGRLIAAGCKFEIAYEKKLWRVYYFFGSPAGRDTAE